MREDRPPDRLSLAGSIDRSRESRPENGSWRADAFAGSRHSRWVEELREPLEIHDLQHAREICGQICRLALQDFAPALLLLPRPERQRVQALTAYCLTLFDFVRQTGLEGESLAAINRWEFELDAALDGQPIGQPVYVLLHDLEQQQPWPREGFDRLHSYARRRCALPRPTDAQSAEQDSLFLGETLVWLASGDRPTESSSRLAAALVRLHALTALGDDLRRHRPRLPITELPDSLELDDTRQADILKDAVEMECQRVRKMMAEAGDRLPLHESLRPAARYCQLATRKLLARIELAGPGLINVTPRLNLVDRLTLLLRSRWH